MESFQKLEEDRITKTKAIVEKYIILSLNPQIHSDNIKQVNLKELIEKISVEGEIKKMIELCKIMQKETEDIQVISTPEIIEEAYKVFAKYISDIPKPQPALHSDHPPLLDPKLEEKYFLLNKILVNCWDSNKLSEIEKESFKEIIKSKQGRKIFGDSLNHFRKKSLFSLSETAYELMRELINNVLDYIIKEDDIENALVILIQSQTYYTCKKDSAGKNQKIYLNEGITKHPLWKQRKFWMTAFETPINEEERMDVSISKEEKDILIFTKISTFIINMVDCGISKEDIEDMVFTFVKHKGLATNYQLTLQVL